MRKLIAAVLLSSAICGCGQTSPPSVPPQRAPERGEVQPQVTTEYAFVQEYVRVLGRIESIRRTAQGDGLDMAGCVRNMERFRIELDGDARVFAGMRLAREDDETRELLAGLLARDASSHALFGDACSQILRGPRPGVDLGNISAQMPRVTALIEAIENSLYEMSGQVFMTMLDRQRANSAGNVDRLVITGEERQSLLRMLDEEFDADTSNQNPDWVIRSAEDLKAELSRSEWKSADEP